MTAMGDTCDVLIIGGGIAGVSIAERLAREACGRGGHLDILVVERASHLAAGSSRGLQGWYHTGPLYAQLEAPGTHDHCRRSYALMRARYGTDSDFAWSEHCSLDPPVNGLAGGQTEGWFGPTMTYLLDDADDPAWEARIERLLGRAADRLASPPLPLRADADGFIRVPTADRAMRPARITADIARAAAASGVRFCFDVMAEDPGDDPGAPVRLRGPDGDRWVRAAHTIFTAGCGMRDIAQVIASEPDTEVSIRTGILVAIAPRLGVDPFARIACDPDDNLNHIPHTCAHGDYSVLGDSTSLPADPCPLACAEVASQTLAKAARLLGDGVLAGRRIAWYACRKAERLVPGQTSRRYECWVRAIDDRRLAVLPGKFSLFPLVAETTVERLAEAGAFGLLRGGVPARGSVPPARLASPVAEEVLWGSAGEGGGGDGLVWGRLLGAASAGEGAPAASRHRAPDDPGYDAA